MSSDLRIQADKVARMGAGEIACPTCDGDPGACCKCRGLVPVDKQTPAPDPVALARGDQPDLHLWCDHCARELATDARSLRRS